MGNRCLALLGVAAALAGCGPEMNVQQGPDSGLVRYNDGMMPNVGTTVASRGSMGPVYMTEALGESGTASDETGILERLNSSIGGVTPNPAIGHATPSAIVQPATVPQPANLPRQSTPVVQGRTRP